MLGITSQYFAPALVGVRTRRVAKGGKAIRQLIGVDSLNADIAGQSLQRRAATLMSAWA